MEKKITLLKVMFIFVLVFTQSILHAQKQCIDCLSRINSVSNQQVLLEKFTIPEGAQTVHISNSLYVSYRSGNPQKFWANLAIATAGVVISTQLNKSITTSEGNSNSTSISSAVPLGISIATLPSIWKNRPKGVPKGGLFILHRDSKGKLLNSWEQAISKDAENSAELLTLDINKPLSEGTLEVYLQNGSKNAIYYWGNQTIKDLVKIEQSPADIISLKEKQIVATCPEGYLPNGQGLCCSTITGDCKINVRVDKKRNPVSKKSTHFSPDEEVTTLTKTELRTRVIESYPSSYSTQSTQSTQNVQVVCVVTEECVDVYNQVCTGGSCTDWELQYSTCTTKTACPDGSTTWTTGGTGGGGGGSTGGGGGTGAVGKQCVNGRDTDGFPCGSPICGSNSRDQYGNPCGTPICNNGYTQYLVPCSYIISDADRMNRRVSVDNLCGGYRRLWYNSFRDNNIITTKEMGGFLTTDNRIILFPSYDNTATTVSFKPQYVDAQNRPILHVFKQQGKIRATVVTYDFNGNPYEATYDIKATIHTHPFTGPTSPGTPEIHPYDIPSEPDKKILATVYSEIEHYILNADTLIKYGTDGVIGSPSSVPCLD